MRALLRQVALLGGSFVLLYAVILALSLVLMPRSASSGRLNTGAAGATVFMTEPKYVFLNRSAVASTAPKIILLGASNIVVGFKPAQLQPYLPGIEVHNLAVGGSNMTQVGQIVDLVQELQGHEAMHNTTYVIGMWYGMFAQDSVRWTSPDRHAGDTDIDIERYRYGFFRRTKHGPEHVLPPRYLDAGVTLIYPYLALDRFVREETHGLRDMIAPRERMRTDAERDATIVSAAQKVEMLRYWDTQLKTRGDLADEQFDKLSATIEKILRSGGRVMLVDLPIPKWHAARSPYMNSYRLHRQQLLAHFAGRPGFRYFDKLGDDDLDFSDEVHPKPRIAAHWSAVLAKALQTDASPNTSVALVHTTSAHE